MPGKPRKPKPPTEVRLSELQEQFLENRNNEKVKTEFCLLIRDYARSLVLKELKRTGGLSKTSPEDVEEAALEAMKLLFGQYRKEGWKVTDSFAGVLFHKVREALYKPPKKNNEIAAQLSLNFTSDSTGKEFIESTQIANLRLPWDEWGLPQEWLSAEDLYLRSVNTAIEDIEDIIDEAYKALPYKSWLLFLNYLLLKVRRPLKGNDLQNLDSPMISDSERKAFDILLLEIYNRIYKKD